jgi:hypothetical protein
LLSGFLVEVQLLQQQQQQQQKTSFQVRVITDTRGV